LARDDQVQRTVTIESPAQCNVRSFMATSELPMAEICDGAPVEFGFATQ